MRLIDADPIMQRLTYNNGTPTVDNYRDGAPVTLTLREIKDLIQNAPTVSPWVRTADRLPADKELKKGLVIISDGHSWFSLQSNKTLKMYPQYYPYWMAIPPLPEVIK